MGNWGKDMGNKIVKRPALRRLATFVATLGMLAMSSGVALMATATAAEEGPNQEGYWETLPGEVCDKTDVGAESGGYLVPSAPEGMEWSKLIIKKGSGNIGVENQVFESPVAGEVYTWVGFDPKQSGGWSHTILCAVPLVATAEISVTQPSCANQNTPAIEFSGENVDFPFEVDGTVAPGETVTVTASASGGALFEGGGTTKVFDDVVFDDAEEDCDIVSPPEDVTPVAPVFIDPDCSTEPQVVLPEPTVVDEEVPSKLGAVVMTADVDGVHYEVSGDIVAGGTVEVTASAIEPAVLAEGSETFWTHTFADVADCTEVLPPGETPTVTPPAVTPTVVTPTVVSAGLLPGSESVRGDRGLVLLATGMLLMLVAAGLGMVRPGGAVRV